MTEQIATTLKPYQVQQLKSIAKDKGISLMKLMQGVLIQFLRSEGKPECHYEEDQAIRLLWEKVAKANADGRGISDIITMRRDPYGHKDTRVEMVVALDLNNYTKTDDPVQILDKVLRAILPDSLLELIREYGIQHHYKGKTVALPLIMWLDTLKVRDVMGAEINQEFEDMLTEASQQEAFNRTTR